jgi:hypothetical protein
MGDIPDCTNGMQYVCLGGLEHQWRYVTLLMVCINMITCHTNLVCCVWSSEYVASTTQYMCPLKGHESMNYQYYLIKRPCSTVVSLHIIMINHV